MTLDEFIAKTQYAVTEASRNISGRHPDRWSVAANPGDLEYLYDTLPEWLSYATGVPEAPTVLGYPLVADPLVEPGSVVVRYEVVAQW
jgi:hypothetical protein